jgi:hypothetical protein
MNTTNETITATAATPNTKKRATNPRAKYTPEFITKVNTQKHAHPISLKIEGVDSDAKILLRALVSCDVAHKTVDSLLGLEVDSTKSYLLGGITTVTPDQAAKVVLALHKLKVNHLDKLRGETQLQVLKMLYNLI